MASLVKDPNNIRLAMLGMVDGNGHPYSWSAIINGGFNAELMSKNPYPTIYEYLSAQPAGALGIPGAKVTHIWCDNPDEARSVAAASLIPNVVQQPTDVIGKVDAVVIPTDKGWEHVDRARPFIEANLPMFIDKPLTDRQDGLRQFVQWKREGHAIMSSSCMRYAHEFADLRRRIAEAGPLRVITMTMAKTWERYGIHALEGVYPFLAPGKWLSVANTGTEKANIVHIRHGDGVDVVLEVISDLYGAFGNLTVAGTGGLLTAAFKDSFGSFKAQLVDFVRFLRTGTDPFDFAQTIELMKIIIAGIRSREQNGRTVLLSEIEA